MTTGRMTTFSDADKRERALAAAQEVPTTIKDKGAFRSVEVSVWDIATLTVLLRRLEDGGGGLATYDERITLRRLIDALEGEEA